MTSFNDYCGLIINQFAHEYAAYYDDDFKETIKGIESAKSKLAYIEIKAREKDTRFILSLMSMTILQMSY